MSLCPTDTPGCPRGFTGRVAPDGGWHHLDSVGAAWDCHPCRVAQRASCLWGHRSGPGHPRVRFLGRFRLVWGQGEPRPRRRCCRSAERPPGGDSEKRPSGEGARGSRGDRGGVPGSGGPGAGAGAGEGCGSRAVLSRLRGGEGSRSRGVLVSGDPGAGQGSRGRDGGPAPRCRLRGPGGAGDAGPPRPSIRPSVPGGGCRGC